MGSLPSKSAKAPSTLPGGRSMACLRRDWFGLFGLKSQPLSKPSQARIPFVGLYKGTQTRDHKLRGAWLWLGRLAALVGFSANIVPVFLGLPAALANLQDLGSTGPFARWGSAELEGAIIALGISPSFIVALILIADVIILAAYGGIALLLFFRYSDRWFGLIVPYLLFGLGVGFSIYGGYAWNLGIGSLPGWIQGSLNIIATMVWPMFFFSWFIFPNGQFAPKWAWPIALGLPIIFIVGSITDFETNAWLFLPLLFIFIFAGLFSQVYRYTRVSSPAQRQQTKWLLFGLVFFTVAIVLSLITIGTSPAQRLLSTLLLTVGLRALAVSFLPVALAISLTRYRLWDVDELVNRALVYGALTTFFTGLFAASTVIINQLSLGLFGDESKTLAPIISAVVVAAVFQPTRKRLEEWIDKRFYPQKKEMTAGLVEAEPGYWPFISMPKLLDSSLKHIAEGLKANPLAVYLTTGETTMKPVKTLGVSQRSLAKIQLTKKQLEEFGKKRAASFEHGGPFLGLIPLIIPIKTKGLVGAIAIGPRTDGRGYSADDLKTLVEVGGRIALSIHAIQVRTTK